MESEERMCVVCFGAVPLPSLEIPAPYIAYTFTFEPNVIVNKLVTFILNSAGLRPSKFYCEIIKV